MSIVILLLREIEQTLILMLVCWFLFSVLNSAFGVKFLHVLSLLRSDEQIHCTSQAITSTGIKKGEIFLADVSTQFKNKNITTDVKVDTNSNVSFRKSIVYFFLVCLSMKCLPFVVFMLFSTSYENFVSDLLTNIGMWTCSFSPPSLSMSQHLDSRPFLASLLLIRDLAR